MIKYAYLTIDDTPSKNTKTLVDYLIANSVPAVFYARGEFVAKAKKELVAAIEQGFLVGNHSFYHPYFSKISLKECYWEIEQTERLLDECYRLAKKPRPLKIIRLPWSDRGAGPDLASPRNANEQEKCHKLQEFLKQEGFSRLNFKGFKEAAIDAPFSWKTGDFKQAYLSNHDAFIANLENYVVQSRREHEIILAHDFDQNYDLLRLTIDFLLQRKIILLPTPIV